MNMSPLMCTKQEFEIKHASKMHFIMNTQPEIESNSNEPRKDQQSHGFISISLRNQCKNLVPHGI